MKAGCAMLVMALMGGASAARFVTKVDDSPLARVVLLIEELKTRIEVDGKAEQQSYDKYACWCENTLARKAGDISNGKEQIVALQTTITKLKGEIAAHAAEIQQLKKDIAANLEAQREATELREKEHAEYAEEKVESEQCIGALEAAVHALTGAGTGKAFLGTIQEAQLLSVVAGVRGVLKRPSVSNAASSDDLQVVERFVENPETFMSGSSDGVSAAQIGNNPFGDYAPQSTQIQGILKGMYDSFAGGLEKDNADEADRQKAFQELMATKKKELGTLEATLEKHTLDEAQKTKNLADSKSLLDDTKVQLAADEAFFAESKAACQDKAMQWAERTRLRTEELQSIGKAIEILQDNEATFHRATSNTVETSNETSFLQTSSDRSVHIQKAYGSLKTLAKKYHSLSLAKIAVQVKSGGHFDDVIASIDEMIKVLRAEEEDDIAHRDRCERSTNKNGNDMEDLTALIAKQEKAIERMNREDTALTEKVDALTADIKDTEGKMAELLEMRNGESDEFKLLLADDAKSVEAIGQAIASLASFYKKNKIPLALAQKEDPEYTVDPDKAPETSWSGGDYGGRKSESSGVIAILSMFKEDLEKEMQTGRADDAKSQAAYEEQKGAMQKTLDAQHSTKVATEKEQVELAAKILDAENAKTAAGATLGNEGEMKTALETDCSWVDSHFDSRRDKRKTEMDGLVEAKNYLAGIEEMD